MGFVFGATSDARLSRANPLGGGSGDWNGAGWDFCACLLWPDAPSLATADQTICEVGGSGGVRVYFDGPSGKIRISEPYSTTNAIWEYTLGTSIATGNYYALYVQRPFDGQPPVVRLDLFVPGSAYLNAAVASRAVNQASVGTRSAATGVLSLGNVAAGGKPFKGSIKCAGWFSGNDVVGTEIDYFGQGLAPFQLLTFVGGTGGNGIECSLADMVNTIGDRAEPEATITTTGTVTLSANSGGHDGPYYDWQVGTYPYSISNIMARYKAGVIGTSRDAVITRPLRRYAADPNGNALTGRRIVEIPDLSGGGAHRGTWTAANQFILATIDGTLRVVSDSNIGIGSEARCMEGPASWGRTSTGAVSCVMIGAGKTTGVPSGGAEWTPIQLDTAALGNKWTLTNRGGNSFQGICFGVAINGQYPPLGQDPRLANACNLGFHFIAHGTGTSIFGQVNDVSNTWTQTNSNATRYVRRFNDGATDNDGQGNSWCEIILWSADKRSEATALWAWSIANYPMAAPASGLGCMVVVGSSTEAGNTAELAPYHSLASRANRRGLHVCAFGLASQASCDEYLTGVSGGSGTFTLGESITNGTQTGRFLAEAGGLMAMFDRSATWATSGTVTGASSGATRNYTGRSDGGGANAIANSARRALVYETLSAYGESSQKVLYNGASNSIVTASSKGILEYEIAKALRTLFRTGLRLTGTAALPSSPAFTAQEVIELVADTSITAVIEVTGGANATGSKLIALCRSRVGTWPQSGTARGRTSGATWAFTAAQQITPGFTIRVPQPRTGSGGTELMDFRDRCRAGVGADFERLVDASLSPYLDDYTGSSDYDNRGVYYGVLPRITALTQSGGVATATTEVAHGLSIGSVNGIKSSGWAESEYNGDFTLTAASGTSLTFTIGGSGTRAASGDGTIQKTDNVHMGQFGHNIVAGQLDDALLPVGGGDDDMGAGVLVVLED